jgi:hypothetical protein
MIAQEPSIRYIHEPFNISKLPCYCGVTFDHWFYYISSANESEFREHLAHAIHPTFNRISLMNLATEMKATKRIRPLTKYISSFFQKRSLVKAPLALFSAPWLANTFDMDVVIVVRHPAAVISSYKSLNWSHPFSHFLKQPALMEEHLADFADEITDFARNEHDMVEQIALLWKLAHHMILKYRQANPDWIFVRHRDLARDPSYGFQEIFKQLNLPFSEKVRQKIMNHSATINISGAENPYSISRHSGQTIWSWQNHLTPKDICRVRKRVEGVSEEFFKDEDWQPVLL